MNEKATTRELRELREMIAALTRDREAAGQEQQAESKEQWQQSVNTDMEPSPVEESQVDDSHENSIHSQLQGFFQKC